MTSRISDEQLAAAAVARAEEAEGDRDELERKLVEARGERDQHYAWLTDLCSALGFDTLDVDQAVEAAQQLRADHDTMRDTLTRAQARGTELLERARRAEAALQAVLGLERLTCAFCEEAPAVRWEESAAPFSEHVCDQCGDERGGDVRDPQFHYNYADELPHAPVIRGAMRLLRKGGDHDQ